jgi:hypothetical protein
VQGTAARLLFDLTATTVSASSPRAAEGLLRDLERIASRAESKRIFPVAFDAQLLAADVVRKTGGSDARARLVRLRDTAKGRGFGLWVTLADTKLRQL